MRRAQSTIWGAKILTPPQKHHMTHDTKLTCHKVPLPKHFPEESIMGRYPFLNSLTGAPRRAAKRQRSKNSRWMHLGVAGIGTRQRIQHCWAQHTLATTNSLFLAWYTITIRSVFIGPIPALMQQMIDLLFCQASLYAHHVTMWSTLDGQL